jgi:leader peptidase (prepilin peptidase)/N-methyltransferase
MAALVVLIGLLGLAVGSFLNVVIYRVPRDESLVSPASHCPSCGAPIRPWHNVPVVAALLTGATLVHGDWWALARAGIGGAVLFGLYFALAFAYPSGMGFGDVKLSGILGGVLGFLSWTTLAVGAFGGFLLGAVVGLVVLAVGRGGRKTALPFGPFMITGALVAIFAAQPIADVYSRLTGR